ncbi:hypothetical protein BCR36DRAFT_582638 [Piromyces finnis]|uniref:PAN2-PAN3 deadenylation complex catalytic subunit PAN2 n=1 Tax=Piromyces finnis TaxID=1754191 RepID=A0A1Y1VBU8_9FUNG|nr:hypothetical protein BCR36DRAFT_582638 [Piromyces finnis]|eukprot:ORX52131.1 hypothetical protein BCR36DRAFT_582638 [Piromyces finnis]
MSLLQENTNNINIHDLSLQNNQNNQKWNERQKFFSSNSFVPVSALSFDAYEELLWCGSELGRLSSYFYNEGQFMNYTSFKSHNSQVRQILSTDAGVFSLSSGNIRLTSRRGLQKWDYTPETIKDFYCMSFTENPSEIVIGGSIDSLLIMNVNRGAITNKIDTNDNTIIMKKTKQIFCASSSGYVYMRDPRSFKVENKIQVHNGTISDIDINNNILATCGFSQRGNMALDPMIKLFDIRTMKSLDPISLENGPSFLKFHPKYSSMLTSISQSGELIIVNINQPSEIEYYDIPINGYCSAFDVSPTGEVIAFGDASGIIHQWSDKEKAMITFDPHQTEIVSPINPPQVIIDDNSPLSLIGMPYYNDRLLSAWPSNMTFSIGRPPPKIPEDILASMKKIDFMGYSKNDSQYVRNQSYFYTNPEIEDNEVPKFRSEQEREKIYKKFIKKEPEIHKVHDESISIDVIPPSYYRKVEIKYSRFGVEDFDFGFYNKTQYAGLETDIQNSYCNSIIQVMFFNEPLKNIVKSHIKTNCLKEFCLSCELGFIVRMLEDAKGSNCQASNFLRAFGTIPQASALGLFEPQPPLVCSSYAALIQNFNRFIYEQLHLELNKQHNKLYVKSDYYKNKNLSYIQQVFGIEIESISRCQCLYENIRQTVIYIIDLVYPRNQSKSSLSMNSLKLNDTSFTEVLQSSIQKENQTKAWCNKCSKYQPTTQLKYLKCLPYVLNINCCVTSEKELIYWKKDNIHNASWLPPVIVIELKSKGCLEIREFDPINDKDLVNSKTVGIYKLKATIVEIAHDKDSLHLVSHINVSENNQKDDWYLFNDFLVQQISQEEVLSYRKWKIPSIVQYVRTNLNELLDLSVLPSTTDTSILVKESFLNRRKNIITTCEPFTEDEIPKQPGYLCAIDAEFVALNKEETEIRSDGTKSLIRPPRMGLARVSVLRGSGPKEITPFIDDYISSSEMIVDYLTEYSGIKAGDLDPALSRHMLVPLKASYKKLRLLVDKGCIFIGHGLANDFRIINIYVPPEQIIDTVQIFFIKNRQRKISLRFLAWYLLKEDIQVETHDSIEDARTALLIYKEYLKLKKEGRFEEVLEDIYKEGASLNWNIPK